MESEMSSEKGLQQTEKALPLADEAATPEAQTTSERSIKGVRWFFVVIGILSQAFLFALDNSVVADIQPQIIESFPGSIDKLPWLSVAFALGGAACTSVWASLFGVFDAKILYIVGVVLFEIGSAICGAANLMDALIFGRVVAGVGGAGVYVGVLTFFSSLTTAAERPLYVGGIGIVWGSGAVLGPVIGGAFAEHATWRWAFYINLVVAGVFAWVYVFILPSVNPQPGKRALQKWTKFDFVGAFLIIGAFGFGITGLSFGGSLYAWDSATIIVTLILGVVFLILFGLQQSFCLWTNFEHRLLPVQYFLSRTHILLFIQTVGGAAPIFVPVYFIPLFFQFTKGDGPLDAAVRLLPYVVIMVFFSLVNGAIMGKEGHYKAWFLAANVLIVIGSALMYTVDENTSNAKIYGYSIILAAGSGCIIQCGFIVAQAIVPRSEMSSAVSFINLSQVGGLVLALTLANTIFLNVAQNRIADALPGADAATVKSAVSGSGSAFLQTLSEESQQRVLHAIVIAISKAYILCIAAGAMGIVLALGMKWESAILVM